uniref:Immunoglobulin V-set domain-containing protein n=1 Tax=Paramormyrops kingsleyae TaxID=1676925 RepID=A0A3B3QC38_9TELE
MMHLVFIICFLGFSSAQSVKEIVSCQTKENNLRTDCLFEPDPAGGHITCDYMNENSLVGSTNSSAKPEATYSHRTNVTIIDKTCRLYLTGFSSDKPQNFTCIIKQKRSVRQTSIVDKRKIPVCSALSFLFQPGSGVQMTILALFVLLELQ